MKKILLTEKVKTLLKPALWGNSQKAIFAEIRKGISSVFISSDSQLVVVLRLEGRELVVVAAAGKNLFGNRQEIINFAQANRALSIRFHTKNPQHLAKGLRGLPVKLVEVRKRVFGKNEHVYKLGVM